jgi:hypothetical protein
VQASNLPGVTEPVYVAGSRIERMYPFGPLPGCAVMITLISHEGQCCIGVNLDSAAVSDPDGLVADLQAGIDEVVALAKPPAPKPAKRARARKATRPGT